MKKSILGIFILLSLVVVSCDKNDDNTPLPNPIDEVYDAPYTPLESINDFNSGVWQYVGAKIGTTNFGYISRTNCLSNNSLILFKNINTLNMDSIYFNNYQSIEFSKNDCKLDYKRVLRELKLKYKGVMSTNVYDDNIIKRDSIKEDGSIVVIRDTIRTTHFRGDFEIGIQKEMLRIEDKFSRGGRTDKVYLYFKKI